MHAQAAPGDPLGALSTGAGLGGEAGLLAIDFATRRRMRVNGRLASAGPDGLEIEVEQAYGNCPQYIHRRELVAGRRPRRWPGRRTMSRRSERSAPSCQPRTAS